MPSVLNIRLQYNKHWLILNITQQYLNAQFITEYYAPKSKHTPTYKILHSNIKKALLGT